MAGKFKQKMLKQQQTKSGQLLVLLVLLMQVKTRNLRLLETVQLVVQLIDYKRLQVK